MESASPSAPLNELRTQFEKISSELLDAYERSTIQTSTQVTPVDLVDAFTQFLLVFEKLDREVGERGIVSNDDVSELGNHAIVFLADLSVWAERLSAPHQKQALETLSLAVADWVIRHHGTIKTLEPIVNALALAANTTQDQDALRKLFKIMATIVDNVAPSVRNDLDQSDPSRPWRILNFNYAIVATRTQDRALMERAFDTLERNLPADAPVFFEEGLKQAQKDVYGEVVKATMQEYFSKWTTRH